MSSGAQMLAGGILLTLTAAMLGEFKGFDVRAVSSGAWLALLYLIFARFRSLPSPPTCGSSTTNRQPKLVTYAYVNPVVAVLLGYAPRRRTLGTRTIVGTLLVLVSVVVITTTPKKKTVTAALVTETESAQQESSEIEPV